jgi:hypothetical protein
LESLKGFMMTTSRKVGQWLKLWKWKLLNVCKKLWNFWKVAHWKEFKEHFTMKKIQGNGCMMKLTKWGLPTMCKLPWSFWEVTPRKNPRKWNNNGCQICACVLIIIYYDSTRGNHPPFNFEVWCFQYTSFAYILLLMS